jgi:two-component system, NarL family, response regulator LiaR
LNLQNPNAEPGPVVNVFLLIDEQPIYRCGVEAVVRGSAYLAWAGSAGSLDQVHTHVPGKVPDVVLVDAALLRPVAAAGLAGLRRSLPAARFIVLADAGDAMRVAGALAAGAAMVLPKSMDDVEMVSGVLAVHLGSSVKPMATAATLPAASMLRRDRDTIGADLTRRERDLLALMAQGLSNHDISGTLKIALPTVKFHIGNILSKLNAYNRTSAVLVALRHNLVDLS